MFCSALGGAQDEIDVDFIIGEDNAAVLGALFLSPALNDSAVPLPIIRFWFTTQLLGLGGHTPNLQTDTTGQALQPDQQYEFDFAAMCLRSRPDGKIGADHIKFLRLSFAPHTAKVLGAVRGNAALVADLAPLVRQLAQLSS